MLYCISVVFEKTLRPHASPLILLFTWLCKNKLFWNQNSEFMRFLLMLTCFLVLSPHCFIVLFPFFRYVCCHHRAQALKIQVKDLKDPSFRLASRLFGEVCIADDSKSVVCFSDVLTCSGLMSFTRSPADGSSSSVLHIHAEYRKCTFWLISAAVTQRNLISRCCLRRAADGASCLLLSQHPQSTHTAAGAL